MSEFNWLWLVLPFYAPLILLAWWGLGVLISIIDALWRVTGNRARWTSLLGDNPRWNEEEVKLYSDLSAALRARGLYVYEWQEADARRRTDFRDQCVAQHEADYYPASHRARFQIPEITV